MDAITALVASFGLMCTYGLARRVWRKATYKKPRARGIDPVGEAEVFLAYGRSSDAVRVLKEAMKDEPQNLSIKVTLLRAYSSAGNCKAYCRLARDVQAQVKDQPVWRTIQENGRLLAPQDPLFAAKA
ncbi:MULTISPECIES: FimV family protein [Aquitalea]|uniref:type IV pilus assembly protein FimV n=1 Tax=Aquitalea TaxID=407217 RepID=UPI000ADBD93B|nr:MULTISPECIES: pilus assembly protein FimV [Aquitalea]